MELSFAASLVAGAGCVVVTLALHVQRLTARHAHEVRAALATACMALEVNHGIDPCDQLSDAKRERIVLAEIQRAGRLMRSLEETAGRSLRRQLSHHMRLLFARARQHRRRREGEFLPHESTAQVVHVWRVQAMRLERRLRLIWRADGRSVYGREDLFIQALSNLVANALRHGTGDVEVRAEASSSHLRVSVTDEGSGLQQPLRQLTAGRSRGRHGHGLPVVAAATRALGGRLASAPAARGAHLVIELPLSVDLTADGRSAWYTAAQDDLERLRRKRSGGRVIPFRRGARGGSGADRARGSQA